MKDKLVEVFTKLNKQVENENKRRRLSGARFIPHARIEILGQTSLLIQPELTVKLTLAQTGDLDAQLLADHFVKKNLKEILPDYGFIYDEDSYLIFIPEGSHFSTFLNLTMIEVVVIDPESALVSKAVKAPEKNIQLIRQAIASEEYPNLISRIVAAGGELRKFI
ncbi:MAG: hypothetical protein A2622_08520 [Bdellovibrionales bacterium RIFCSPHIGHO2_01_FULL_40_29]|nr:MAG: hypothetical protein A2622_08520 [Bdellovibrionales bacterium RIFCSPHIGHO2_01_FULL_40_29]OFZ35533.1 MAG: hypothetical protein A3D17_07755 [Bdellovibrionales bacterium RIFCSPHIGHO2_02_FULL_40_15]